MSLMKLGGRLHRFDEGPAYQLVRARKQRPDGVAQYQSIRLRSVLPTVAMVDALLLVLATHPYAPTIGVIALILWSITGAQQAIQALSLVVVIKFLNPAIFQFSGPFALLAWLALAVAGLRISYDNIRVRSGRHPVVPWLIAFAVVVSIQSMLFSISVAVSIFKMLSFTFAAITILLGFKVTGMKSLDWTSWFVGLWIAVLVLSVPTWFFPGIGFHVNGHGFQGILNHPQALGVFLAPMVAWFTARIIFSPSKGNYWMYAVLPAAWSMMIVTEARTALIAVAVGLLSVVFVALFRRPEWRRWIRNAILKPVSIFIALTILAIALLRPGLISETSVAFMHKGERTATIEKSFEESRGGLIGSEWRNFVDHPVSGIGFGASLDPEFRPVIESLTGLPLSASTEKGFLPSAILEETGVVGATWFLVFLIALMRHALSNAEVALVWLFVTSLCVNAGEMVFFSAGGLGLYIWLLIGWTTSRRWEDNHAT
jgi:hypothetical protein